MRVGARDVAEQRSVLAGIAVEQKRKVRRDQSISGARRHDRRERSRVDEGKQGERVAFGERAWDVHERVFR